MSTRFLQCQEIKVKTQDSRLKASYHQAIYLRYRSFKRGGVSELSYAQSEDRSQATSFLLRPRTVTATVSSQGLRNTQFPRFVRPTFKPRQSQGTPRVTGSGGACSYSACLAPTDLPRDLLVVLFVHEKYVTSHHRDGEAGVSQSLRT
jgi:hypothetical protein